MMKKHFRKFGSIFVLTVLIISTALAQRSNSFTTIILVRHAEKDTGGTNPPLTVRGTERAEALSRILGDTPISTVYVTQYTRTQQTASVVAARTGITPIVFDVDLSKPKQDGKAIAQDILKRHAGKTVLVSNHSNIIPFIIDALGGGWIGNIDDRSYDNLFILVRDSSGKCKLLKLKYGASSN